MTKTVWILSLVGVALVLLVVGMLINPAGFRMGASIDGGGVMYSTPPPAGREDLAKGLPAEAPRAPPAAAGAAPAAGDSASSSRRIVYTAQIQLTVTDLDAAQ